ncbi:hypothetical protein ACMFY5_23350, partial [Pseudomonas sihuiensis]
GWVFFLFIRAPASGVPAFPSFILGRAGGRRRYPASCGLPQARAEQFLSESPHTLCIDYFSQKRINIISLIGGRPCSIPSSHLA